MYETEGRVVRPAVLEGEEGRRAWCSLGPRSLSERPEIAPPGKRGFMKRSMKLCLLVSALALAACGRGSGGGAANGEGPTSGPGSAAPGHASSKPARIVAGVTACDSYITSWKSCLTEAAKTEPKLTPAAQEETLNAMAGNIRNLCATGATEKLDEVEWAKCVISCKEGRAHKLKGACEKFNQDNKGTSQSNTPALSATMSAKVDVVTIGTKDCDDYLAKCRACWRAKYGDDADGIMASQLVSHFYESNLKGMGPMATTADSCKQMLASFSPDKCT
jgi:hypothetical protein